MTDYPLSSYEFGHRIDRAERSADLCRIGGLMDQIDATEIIKNLLGEILPDVHEEHRERWAQAALARLASAPEHPILVCRVYEAEEWATAEGERERVLGLIDDIRKFAIGMNAQEILADLANDVRGEG